MKLINRTKFEIPQEIRNPYKVHKYLYLAIIGIALIVVSLSYLRLFNISATVKGITQNVSYSCIASAVFACIVDYVNVAEKNRKSNAIYNIVYSKLSASIYEYCQEWATVCAIGFNDHNYDYEKHKWIEWYEETKKKFHELNDLERQHELMYYFQKQFDYQASVIEEETQHLQNISYELMINDTANDTILTSLDDLRSEFHFFEFKLHAKYWLEQDEDAFNKDPEFIWKWMDAVNGDLTNYLDEWRDLSYLNEYLFSPKRMYDNRNETLTAMKISENKRKSRNIK